MDTTRMPAKSILKQTPTPSKPTLSDEQKAQAERNRRNLGLALHHANKIQTRKDIEAQILKSIETLLDYPSDPVPTSAEAANFARDVAIFQPSDFAALIEERNADGKCGYALCSKAPRSVTLGSAGLWKLKGEGAARYCSNDCFKKALYVKTQLSEVPAWEREAGEELRVELYGDEAATTSVRRSDDIGVMNDRQLASERAEQPGSLRAGRVIADSIVEKKTSSYRPPAEGFGDGSTYDEIEGYVPSNRSEQVPEQKQESNLSPNAESKANGLRSFDRSGVDEEEQSWSELFKNLSAS